MIRAVLFDLDGVIRHFDPHQLAEIEHRHGLPSGAVHSAAFARLLLAEVTTGRLSRADWIVRIGEQIGIDAAVDWGRLVATVDHRMLDLSDELRASGFVTAILTNGTDTIPTELEELGIASHFDAIFNSAEIGFAKPDRAAFEHVLMALALPGQEIFFTDDSPTKVSGAIELDITTHLFAGVQSLRDELRTHGVLGG